LSAGRSFHAQPALRFPTSYGLDRHAKHLGGLPHADPGGATIRVFVDHVCHPWATKAKIPLYFRIVSRYSTEDQRLATVGGEPRPAHFAA
jgi:hypothetical protein